VTEIFDQKCVSLVTLTGKRAASMMYSGQACQSQWFQMSGYFRPRLQVTWKNSCSLLMLPLECPVHNCFIWYTNLLC